MIIGTISGRPRWREANQVMETAYTGFEEQAITAAANGGWTISSASGWTTAAGDYATGKTGFNIGTSRTVSKANIPAGDYVVSFWYNEGQISVGAFGASPYVTDWTYFEQEISYAGSGNTLNITGLSYGTTLIDELRLFPRDAIMKTFAYDDGRRLLLSISDENSQSAHYEYDDAQRLQLVRNPPLARGCMYYYELARGSAPCLLSFGLRPV